MPMYDFRCTSPACQQVFEALKPQQTETTPCPVCGKEAKKQFSSQGQNFKFNYFGESYN